MVGAYVLERDAETTVLGRLISRAASGRGGLVAIEGPAGIGKTRLLAHVRQQATNSGWRVLDTRCTPMSSTIGFCVLRDWFGTLAHRAGVGVHPFDGPGQALISLADGHDRTIGDLAYAVRWVLEDLTTDQPVLLVVDDLQWADAASVESLDLLANALQQLPCLIVYAVRSGEPSAASEALNRLVAASTVLNPAPLSRDAVAEQVRAVRPRAGDAEIDEVHRTSGGVPFFVNELIAGPNGTPDTVVGSVTGRLSRLNPTATESARAACVLGQQANVGMVAELTGQPLASVADDISSLVSAQILTAEGGHLRGRHPLVADAVLAPMTAHESSQLHHKAAVVLMRRGAARAVVADHLMNTLPGTDADVRARLKEQGELALSTGSLEVAGRYLTRALAEGPVGTADVDLLSATARALAGQRLLDEALTVWERATELADDDKTRDRLRAEAGDALMVAGRHRDAQETFGLRLDPESGKQRLFARMVLAGLLNGVSLDYLHTQVGEVLANPPLGETQDDRLSLAAASVVLTFECRDGELARDLAIRSIGGSAMLEDVTSEGSMLYLATSVLHWMSAFGEGDAILTSAIDDAKARNSSMELATASVCRGSIRMHMGMISEAMQDLEVALAQRVHGWNAFLAPLLAAMVECRIARGELDRIADHRDELEELTHAPGLTGAFATYALADLAAAHSDHEQASHLYAQVGRLVEGRMDNPAILPWRAGQALSRIRMGQPREAVNLARENVDKARAFGSPYAIAQALRTLAAVDATGDRVSMLRDALVALQQTQAPRLEAQVATDLAGMLLLTQGMGDTHEPVVLLRRAESYAAFQELRPLGDRVHRILERIGEPVKRSTTENLTSLTVSERRVADLAASGLSNRQIAQQLFVTVKAVEWHLSNVYRKLGIRSRTRLPGLLNVPPQLAGPSLTQRAG